MKAKLFSIFAIGSVIVSCSVFQRTSDSGYQDSKTGSGRSGLTGRRKTLDQRGDYGSPQKLTEMRRLQNLENALSTKKEVEQYSKVLPYFKSDEERLEFLNRGNFEDKQQWLNEKKFLSRPQEISNELKELVTAQDITLGMPQVLVKKSWGEPDIVEVSGNPSFRNERWRYNRYVSTSDGYKPEKKSVYFEGGRVIGWEVE
jgi:hypothetical protein